MSRARNIYYAYSDTDDLIVYGTAEQVSAALGVKKETIYKSRTKSGHGLKGRVTLYAERELKASRKEGDRLKRWRLSLGLTQAELGRMTYRSTSSICGYENGKTGFEFYEIKDGCGEFAPMCAMAEEETTG